ncbi:MAG TPA: hypothetical protein VK191_13435 [Symbiobacteriaceae bacterium]|nr:hypothetical protein [Symbiobacteriaceae bacterium]
MRWSSLLLCLLLTLVPAPALAEGVRPDLIPVVAPETMLAGLDQPLVARTLCTADPSKDRRWEVLNLTKEAVTFTWQVAETGQSGTFTLPGGARTEVKALAGTGKATLRLLVAGEVVTTSPNWGTKCGAQQPNQGLTWRKGAPPKAPTRPAKPSPGRSLTWQQRSAPPKAPTRPAKPAPGRNLTWQQKGAPPKAPTRPAKPAPGRSLTWQQGAPPAPKPLVQVTPLCFRQPTERRWRVQSLTDSPLTLSMQVEGKPRGDLVLAPRGETELALEAVAPPNRLRLFANGKLVAESPNPETPCSTQ